MRESFLRLLPSEPLKCLLSSDKRSANYPRMTDITPDTNWGNQPYASKTVTRHSTPLHPRRPEESRTLPVGSRDGPFPAENSTPLSPVVGQGENAATLISEWEGPLLNRQPSSSVENHVRRTLTWDEHSTEERSARTIGGASATQRTAPGGSPHINPSTRLQDLEVTLLKNSRLYRRRLTTRLVCVFCCIVLLGVVICFTSVALLVRNETPRGLLIGYDGSFQLKRGNSTYCIKGSTREVAAYRKNITKTVQEKLDAVFRNLSVESSYSGSLVEDFACVLRPSTNYAATHVNFVLFWRQKRARDGALQSVPEPEDLLNTFHDYLERHPQDTTSELDIDKDTVKIAGRQRIL